MLRSDSKRPKSMASWKERAAFRRTGDTTAGSPLEAEAEAVRETVSETSSVVTRPTGADGWRVMPGRERTGDVEEVREISLGRAFP